jgi:hypothetical protein
MNIQVKDPSTGALLLLEAKPEQHRGEHGFRIRHPNGSGFLVVNRSGSWRVADDHHIEADFLVNIGLALEGHSVREQTGPNMKDNDQSDGNPLYINSGMGNEGDVNPNKP